MLRASAAVEKLGIPTVSLICTSFVVQGKLRLPVQGCLIYPISPYPGFVNLHSSEDLQKNVKAVMVDQIINSLTVQPKEGKADPSPEPHTKDIVFEGTFDEVNGFFYDHEWSDGLPIVPPTQERVEKFLKYTDRGSDEV